MARTPKKSTPKRTASPTSDSDVSHSPSYVKGYEEQFNEEEEEEDESQEGDDAARKTRLPLNEMRT